MTECCEGRKHLFHCCLMRYLSPVAFQKHLNAHMIEGMLGLHTVCLHYYPGISKLMHFTKKKRRGGGERKYIFLVQPAYRSSRIISAEKTGLRNSSHVWLLVTQSFPAIRLWQRGWTPLCSFRSAARRSHGNLFHGIATGRPEPSTKYPPAFYSSPIDSRADVPSTIH